MEQDDVVYLSLLIFTIVFGCFFRELKNSDFKKWISTAVGFTLVLFVSARHVLHPILCVLVNSSIILFVNKKFCHIASFSFTFLYLIFFRTSVYFGIPYAPGHTNMIQMMLTLKIVGLAFEVHDSYILQKKKKEIGEIYKNEINPDFWEIVHYSFSFIGVLTGPYYTYKTFCDYYSQNFHEYANCKLTTLKKLTLIPLYAIIYLTTSYYFPIEYADSDEFYNVRSFWFRLFYITPVFITFRMRIYIGLILSECACTMTGLGAYPSFTEPKSGMGPTKKLDLMNQFKFHEFSNSRKAMISCNFDTVSNINTWHTEFDPSVRSSIRYWNMCVQYWMAFIVYKRFPNKILRTVATFAVSSIWHGIYAGYFLCLGVVPFYLPIEDIWMNLLREYGGSGKKKKILNVLFWMIRTQAFSYMGMAFSLLTMERSLKYYKSIYYIYHFTSLAALISGFIIKKFISRQKLAKAE